MCTRTELVSNLQQAPDSASHAADPISVRWAKALRRDCAADRISAKNERASWQAHATTARRGPHASPSVAGVADELVAIGESEEHYAPTNR